MRIFPTVRVVFVLAALFSPGRAAAQGAAPDTAQAAQLCPASVGVFIQIDNLAEARALFAHDPLIEYLRTLGPAPQEPKPWRQLQTMLGMDGDQIIDRFFGRSVAVVAQKAEDGSPWLLLSRVSADDANVLVTKLNLRHLDQLNGFDAYATADDKARLAFGRGWMVVADKRFENVAGNFIKQAGDGPALADDPDFKAALAKMPADRTAVAFARDPGKGEAHVLAAVRRGRDVSLHYAGHSPKFKDLLDRRADAKALEFGPLPADTLAAATLNLYDPNPQDNPFVDRLLAPKTFRGDVLPKLAAPLVVFLGEVKGAAVDPDPGLDVPVLGVAVKLKDPAVADDLTRVFDGLMLLANIATVQWQTQPIVVAGASYHETSYRTAGLGAALAERTGRPELATLKLSYGRVGDWYVLCTQDTFFKRCIDASGDATAALVNSPAFKAMAVGEQRGAIATYVARPAAVARHMQTWISHWQKVRPAVIASAVGDPQTPEAKGVKGVMILTHVLAHFKSVSFQAHVAEGGELRGRLDVVRE